MSGIGITPVHLVGWNQNGERPWMPRTLAQATPAAPAVPMTPSAPSPWGQRLQKAAIGIAMAGGGAYAMINIPEARKTNKVALGLLGGGLLVGAALNFYSVAQPQA